MIFRFTAQVWYWRGPAPFHFITVPAADAEAIREVSGMLTYGWGMIPVRAVVRGSDFSTAMWPKDGGYCLPLKAAVRKAGKIEVGDLVDVELTIGAG